MGLCVTLTMIPTWLHFISETIKPWFPQLPPTAGMSEKEKL
jgi:hypothetical protein